MNKQETLQKTQNELLWTSFLVEQYKDEFTKNTLFRKLKPQYPFLSIRRISAACEKYNLRMLSEAEWKVLVGNEYNTQVMSPEEFITNSKTIHGKYNYDKTNYTKSHSYVTITCPKHGDFEQHAYAHLAGKGCRQCGAGISQSKDEIEILNFITNLGFETISGDRKLLSGKEIDILVPSKNLGIEYNGIMYHSIGNHSSDKFNKLYSNKEKQKHNFKTNKMNDLGIQLFHIFDIEYKHKKVLWESMIKSALGVNQKIGARKTEIKLVNNKDAKEFQEENHMQGSAPAKVKIGLYYENILVSLMTFSKGRASISAKSEWELIRFCSKQNLTVQGGASKLFSYFVKTYNPNNIKSFANRRWSNGNLYHKLGFELSHISEPNYFYFKENDRTLYSRNKFQKHKLKKFVEYSEDKTEWEIMKDSGYRKIYDSGNLVFIWNKLQ